MDNEIEVRLCQALQDEAAYCAAREPAGFAAACRARRQLSWHPILAIAALATLALIPILRTPQIPEWEPAAPSPAVVTPGESCTTPSPPCPSASPPVPRPC